MQVIAQVELHLHLSVANLLAELPQSRLIAIGWRHAHKLPSKLSGHTAPELCSAGQIELHPPLAQLPLQTPQLLIGALAHPNEHTAAGSTASKVVNRIGHLTPATQAKEADAEVSPAGLL